MAETFKVEILSPARAVLSTEAEMVIIPGSEGQFTALPRHAPMISSLGMDVLTVVIDGKRTDYFVSGGIVDVRPDSVTVLAEEASAVSDLNMADLNVRMTEAEEALKLAASPAQRTHAQNAINRLEAMKAAVAA